ncbi:amino acid ABC transporter permease [Anaerocolumna cellulosilytica]|uniref:Amino acid ABC transporter permease n=1 Tax=Anaerocolumna cellulosilytica TaxID=433286 RepID=A0A6S6R1F5_9FIRM|nr:amino acid ABC transporter permease [Anaerocolumna cellulosilytica]MBB5194470.1 putative glutamine transport system permease protein [Anaerocolumna cellulosilytica]BCJ93415.1 amino acid ABC transporter permease [Anaerocolumna cellulosilytica]
MSDILSRNNLLFMLDGLKLTVFLSIATILLSMCFGTLFAIIRTYAKGNLLPLAKITGAYIEFFRCTPNILWIFFFRFIIPGNVIAKEIFAFTLFTSAIMAEIIRGGLNGIPKGQFEAAASQGFSFPRTMLYLILPQTYKQIIPSVLSQMITVIKDTAYLKAVDIAELSRNTDIVMGKAVTATEIMSLFALLAAIYFVICFILSVSVRTYQKKVMATG